MIKEQCMKIKIDQVLDQKGRSRFWLSEQTGITYPNIRNLCNNTTSSIKFEVMQKICDVLDCNVEDILEKDINKRDTGE